MPTRMHILLRFCTFLLTLVLFIAPARGDTPLLPENGTFSLEETRIRKTGLFTQGLVFNGDVLYESTGKYGQSAVYSYHKQDLSPLASISLPPDQFGEGITVHGDRLYQLTWRSRLIRVYDTRLNFQKYLPVDMEGWGLTTDGTSLIASDGSDNLYFLDPDSARLKHKLTVTHPTGKRYQNLNELEWVNGVILANVWHQDIVLVIHPKSGMVIAQYNFETLSQQASKAMKTRNGEQVLNGLAWDPNKQVLLVTGKEWPLWFTVRLQPTPHLPN